MKRTKLTTWKERPATIMWTPFALPSLVDAWSAIPPPTDCKMRAIRSDVMNVIEYAFGERRELWIP